MLPKAEVEMTSMARRGKDYAQSGRFDLAEIEFRRLLSSYPKLDNIWNDLGYVLQGQERLPEAAAAFEKALALDPYNLEARDNLARVLYRQDKLDDARLEFERLLVISGEVAGNRAVPVHARELSPPELASVYRNLAIISYVLGFIDEATCLSRRALDLAQDLYQTSQHIRLLMATGATRAALELLRNAIIARGGVVGPELYLDYAVALYATEQPTIAAQALARVLATPSATRDDKRAARSLLWAYSPEPAANETESELESLYPDESVEDFRREACALSMAEYEKYWPDSVAERVRALRKENCSDEV